jgi:para-aminobenzoate synthetase component 1
VKEVGSLAAVETTLRAHGFFGGGAAGVVADVYLGYGLSDALRRDSHPAPPEPCPLPPAAVRIRPEGEEEAAAGGFSIGQWQHSWSTAEHAAAVDAVRMAIERGDVYQVNLVQHLAAPFRGDPAGLAERLAPLLPLHGRPFVGEGWAIVSASPELFLARRGRRVWTMPIKGTRPAGGVGLTESAKDAAEHVMIVDLERNDLSRVCKTGSVTWPELMTERPLAGVEHLVSLVEGAPKISALDHVAALEPVGRGASMGALGTIWPNGDFDLALTIRTFAIAEGRIHLWVGGGIVWDSDADAEIEESWVKARPLLAAVGSPLPEPVRA